MNVANYQRQCEGHSGQRCPKKPSCGMDCHFNTCEGGRVVDTAVHEQPPSRLGTFQPDYGVRRYVRETTLTPLGWAVAVISIFAFVYGAYRFYSNN